MRSRSCGSRPTGPTGQASTWTSRKRTSSTSMRTAAPTSFGAWPTIRQPSTNSGCDRQSMRKQERAPWRALLLSPRLRRRTPSPRPHRWIALAERLDQFDKVAIGIAEKGDPRGGCGRRKILRRGLEGHAAGHQVDVGLVDVLHFPGEVVPTRAVGGANRTVLLDELD